MKLEFPIEYFWDEVRDGFYVDGMMKRCWAAQLEVLNEIDKVCKKLGIRWFADNGTLLGAVRHGGYVPWDDDLDICMLRDDYEIFHKKAKELLPEGYSFLYYDEPLDSKTHVWDLLLRIVNNNDYSLDPEFIGKYHDFPFITGVDIFPLDFVCPDPDEEETRRAVAALVQKAAYMGELNDMEIPEEAAELLDQIEIAANVKLDRKNNIKFQLFSLLDRLFSMYNRAEASEVVLMPYWVGNHDHKYQLKWYENSVEIPFETTRIPAPAYFDDVLRTEYGDYIHPYRGGGVHDYPYYKKQYNMIVTKEGKSLFKYYFEPKDMELQRPEPKVKTRNQALELADLLGEAQEHIVGGLESGNLDLALDLLAQCQELAVRIGNLIEAAEGEGHVTVSHLEKYCEVVYEIHTELSGGASPEPDLVKSKLDEVLSDVKQSIEADVPIRREVVFLPFSEKHWDSMRPYWKREMADPYATVYVIPIPFYDRELEGVPRELIFDRNAYPEEVEVTDFNDYNFAEHHPDTMYIQSVYDEFNPTTMVHPFFYTPHLRQFTDELIYIPYFRIEEIPEDDEKGKYTLDQFVKMPGMVQVDRAIVQSEAVRESYIEALVEMAGEETRETWEEKVEVSDLKPEELPAKEAADIPEEWKDCVIRPDGTMKKIILYYTSSAVLLGKDLAAVEKLRRVLDIFKENREDVALLWRPDPVTRDSLRAANSKVWSRYRDILEKYRKEGWGILDDSRDPYRAMKIADAYYGDPSFYVIKCKNAGKPVMLANVEV